MCLLYIYTHNYNNDEQWTNITILSTTATVHNNSDDKHINHNCYSTIKTINLTASATDTTKVTSLLSKTSSHVKT